jgi:hypothetical protein
VLCGALWGPWCPTPVGPPSWGHDQCPRASGPAARVLWAARWAVVPGALARLAEHPDVRVRKAVAGNPASPPEALVRLAADPDLAVVLAVAQNAGCPPSLLAQLARHRSPRVRQAVALHTRTRAEVRSSLAADPSPAVLAALCGAPLPETPDAREDAMPTETPDAKENAMPKDAPAPERHLEATYRVLQVLGPQLWEAAGHDAEQFGRLLAQVAHQVLGQHLAWARESSQAGEIVPLLGTVMGVDNPYTKEGRVYDLARVRFQPHVGKLQREQNLWVDLREPDGPQLALRAAQLVGQRCRIHQQVRLVVGPDGEPLLTDEGRPRQHHYVVRIEVPKDQVAPASTETIVNGTWDAFADGDPWAE